MRGKILYPSILVLPGATNGMSFKDAKFMTPLPADTLTKKEEETMKESLENYRPVRQITVRAKQ